MPSGIHSVTDRIIIWPDGTFDVEGPDQRDDLNEDLERYDDIQIETLKELLAAKWMVMEMGRMTELIKQREDHLRLTEERTRGAKQ